MIFLRRFAKFGMVGSIGLVLNLALLYLFQEFCFRSIQSSEIRLNLSLSLAIIGSTVSNFTLNRIWTWADRKTAREKPLILQLLQYFGSCGAAIGLQFLITISLSGTIHYLAANAVAVGFGAATNYLLNDIWTFRRDRWHAWKGGSLKIADSHPQLDLMKPISGCVSFFSPLILGGVFLAAAWIKGSDLELFMRQIQAYGIIAEPTLVRPAAWGLVIAEMLLGAALLLRLRRRWVLSATFAMLGLFVGVTLWAMVHGGVDDCGCFGTLVRREPWETLAEDAVLLALAAWLWRAWRPFDEPAGRAMRKALAVGCAGIAAVLLPLVSGNPPTVAAPGMEARVLAESKIEGLDGVDLSRGSYLISVMSTDCLHCREAVTYLNILDEYAEAFRVVALCADGPEDCERFVRETGPRYPIGRIEEAAFWKLIGEGGPPRFILVQDRTVKGSWRNEVPDEEELSAALAGQAGSPRAG